MPTLKLPPLSLYVHIPWCVRKCPYCDFNSHSTQSSAQNGGIPEQEYLKQLLLDMNFEQENAQNRKLTSIFFGGGTPSLFSDSTIATIIEAAEKTFGFEDEIEITLEANPGTAEQSKFSGFFNGGVNRLSLGVQSFNPKHLNVLGRIHSSDEAKNAIAMAKSAGFRRINIDLMHGLPEQTLEDALFDIETAVSLGPDHLSWYQLTIEPNTEFFSAPPRLPEDDNLADIQEAGYERINQLGFHQYEVSAYAKSTSAKAKHNLNYWQFGDYIGVGAGSHSKITDLNTGHIRRYWKTRLPTDYMKRVASQYQNPCTAGEKVIASSELPLEFFMNALRLTQGVTIQTYESFTGLPFSNLDLSELIQKELLEVNNTIVRPTHLGTRYLNNVLDHFLVT